MAIQKSPGPLLKSKFKGIIDVIPLKWRSKLGLTSLVQEQPPDVNPTALGDTTSDGIRVVSSVQQERTDERKKTDVFIADPVGSTMVEYFRTKDGQIGTRTHTVRNEGETLPTLDELTVEADQEAWGDELIEQIVSTVPNLFGSNDYKVERPDRTPPEFGALLNVTETSVTVSGIATLPTLDVGELFREEQQVTDQTKRVTVRFRDLSSLPLTLVDKDTDEHKEVVTVTKTWQLDTTVPPAPTSSTDVKLTRLGDGTSIQIVLGIPNVFGGQDYSRERPDRTPPDFGALLEVTEFSETIDGTASDPTLATGELTRREVQITKFTKRVTVRARNVASLPITIVNSETNPEKQVVVVTRIWELASVTPAPPTDVRDVSFEKLGDGTAIETRRTAPSLFAHQVYMVEIPDRVPTDFGSLLRIGESEQIIDGTAALPTLGAGELMRRQEQITEFTIRLTVRARDVSSLPRTLVNKDTSRVKQVVTITRIWELDSTTPAVPTATQDVSFEKLGDGTAIETRKVETVFPGPVYSKSIENLIPPKFRSQIPTTISDITSTGTANSNPTLATGELSHEEQQIDAFNIRTKSVSFGSISPPVTHTDKELSPEYGGATLDVVYTLHTQGSLSVQEGLLVVACELVDLGNGYEVRTTRTAEGGVWTELEGTEVDPRTGIVIDVKKKVVAAGTLGGVGVNGYTDVKPLEKWRSLQIASKLDVSSLPGTVTWETTIEHAFPNTLLGATLIWEQAWTEDSYDFDSGLLLDMVQGYAGPCRAKITESFSNGPPSDIVTVTKFFPQGHMIGIAWAYANSDSGVTRASARTFSISPALHGDIDLGTSVLQEHGGIIQASRTLVATVPSGLPPTDSLITKDVNVERWRFGIFFRRLTEIYVPS